MNSDKLPSTITECPDDDTRNLASAQWLRGSPDEKDQALLRCMQITKQSAIQKAQNARQEAYTQWND